MSDEETKKICKKVIESLQAKSIKDMGKVMGALKKEYGDVLDFSKVSNFIKEFFKMIMKYPKEYLDEIKLRVKVSQVVSKYVQLKKEVKNLLVCPRLRMKKHLHLQ